jgi:hypothetical protein
MVFWHFLSKLHLGKKIEYAKLNNGKLLLTKPEISKDVSSGRLPPYLYCLSNIVGGSLFTEDELQVLKIQLTCRARIFKFNGNPDHIEYEYLSRDFDLIDMKVEKSGDWPVAFRQYLLLNSDAVESWSYDRKSLEVEFRQQFRALVEGRLKSEDFFMTDVLIDDQIVMASLIAQKLNYKSS